MAPPTHVTVTAPPGRRTPVAPADGVEPGGGLLYVTQDAVHRVRYSHTVIRSIGRRDLTLCNMNGAPVESAELASAPEPLDGGKIELARFAAPMHPELDKRGVKPGDAVPVQGAK